MAAVTRVKGRPVVVIPGRVREKVLNMTMDRAGLAGQVVTNDGSVWTLAEAGATVAHGLLLQDCALGVEPEVAITGEVGGFSGLTPYTDLYVDATTDGEIGDTKPSNGVLQMRAVTETKIAFDFGP